MRRVCVFCGSQVGRDPAYAAAARTLGRTLVARNLGLVFGGGGIGLMRIVADEVLAGGGEVIGVIPHVLVARELAHARVRDLRIVRSMHERKAVMTELADAFVALPGGLGTLEEVFETLSWRQLGIHDTPCGLLEVNGFWAGIRHHLDAAVREGFLRPEHRALLIEAPDAASLLDRLARACSSRDDPR